MTEALFEILFGKRREFRFRHFLGVWTQIWGFLGVWGPKPRNLASRPGKPEFWEFSGIFALFSEFFGIFWKKVARIVKNWPNFMRRRPEIWVGLYRPLFKGKTWQMPTKSPGAFFSIFFFQCLNRPMISRGVRKKWGFHFPPRGDLGSAPKNWGPGPPSQGPQGPQGPENPEKPGFLAFFRVFWPFFRVFSGFFRNFSAADPNFSEFSGIFGNFREIPGFRVLAGLGPQKPQIWPIFGKSGTFRHFSDAVRSTSPHTCIQACVCPYFSWTVQERT